jgi:hypothetical protein
MRGPDGVVPAARVLHERLLAEGLHPEAPRVGTDGGQYETGLSPCDGCYDLAAAVIDSYAVTWQGPRARQS